MSALGPGVWGETLPVGSTPLSCRASLLVRLVPLVPLTSSLSPQPQTNSTKNSAAVTSPKGTLPPAALVLSLSAPCFWALLHPGCVVATRQEAWGEGGVQPQPVSGGRSVLQPPLPLGCGMRAKPYPGSPGAVQGSRPQVPGTGSLLPG